MPLFTVRSIAVIGAGPAGLSAARTLLAYGSYDRIVVFEQRSDVGGVWKYSAQPTDREHVPQESPLAPTDPPLPPPAEGPETGPIFPSPMYDKLHVNLLHPLMGFRDLTIAEALEEEGQNLLPVFPTRQTIEAYLQRYARDVYHLIRFSTVVDDVQRLEDAWHVRSTVLATQTQTTDVFDAIIVANGHYETTFLPAIAGIAAFAAAHPGVVTHAKRYRSAAAFAGKKVVVVGNGASGIDIAHQINAVCRRPLSLSVRTPTAPETLARLDGCTELPSIREFLVAERGVRLVDGRVLRDLDAIVFCTGYLFSLPFLRSLDPQPVTDGRCIPRLYRHLFHIDHPTLAFLGVPLKVTPFPLVQSQMAVVARVWNNTLALPPRAAMDAWVAAAVDKTRGRTYHLFPPGGDGLYINAIHAWVMEQSTDPPADPARVLPFFDDRMRWMRKITFLAKARFEDTGATATTLAELGFNYEPGAGSGDLVDLYF